MKIAMIYDARDIVGGGRIHVKNICKQLCTNHDCSIDLFVRKIKGQTIPLIENIPGLHICYYGPNTSFFNPFGRILSIIDGSIAIIVKNRKEQYDIIHAHSYFPLLSGKIASIVTKISIIATIHGSQIMDISKKDIAYHIQKRLLTKIRYNYQICVGSNFLQYPNINTNIINIGNGVNIDEFAGDKIPHDEFTILFVGRLEWTKGVDILIDAIGHIQKQKLTQKKFTVKIVGYGYEKDIYKELVSKKNLDHLISFEGQKTGKELVQYYKSSDLMVVPSRAEGFGIIILEAMVSGVPVIATKSGGPEDIINHGYNGILIEKDSPLGLANEIIKFINKEHNITNLTSNGTQTIKQHYSRKIIGTQIFILYQQIIG